MNKKKTILHNTFICISIHYARFHFNSNIESISIHSLHNAHISIRFNLFFSFISLFRFLFSFCNTNFYFIYFFPINFCVRSIWFTVELKAFSVRTVKPCLCALYTLNTNSFSNLNRLIICNAHSLNKKKN